MSQAIMKIQAINDTQTIESREAAKMLGKNHGDLMDSINLYVSYLEKGETPLPNFFIPSVYTSEQNRTFPCYLITRKGCEMIAHKMIGEKGIQFTAAYIERFHEMETELTPSEKFLQIAQNAVALERQLDEQGKEIYELKQSQTKIEQKLDTAVKIFATSDKSWKETMEVTIRELVKSTGTTDARLRGFMYQDLEAIAGVSLQSRLIRRKARMKGNGATYKECHAVTKLDIISYDKKLRPIFESIIKKYQAVNVMEQLTLVEGQEGLQ